MKHLATNLGATRATKTARAITPAKAKEITTPAESVKLAGEFTVKFSDATDQWIIRGKTGQVRLADKSVIAICLLNKAKHFPRGERDAVRDTLKSYRKAWKKLTPETKEAWMKKAQLIFSPARKEYHATIKPLASSATTDSRFTLERFAVSLTKGGIVHVASRATHRPEVAAK